MQRTTFSVLFYIRRTKLTREGEAPVLLRLTVNGIRTDLYVKKTIAPALWNYLSVRELHVLNLLVSQYLDFAELQALEQRPMTMAQWIEKLDGVLSMGSRPLLAGAGTVSHEQAVEKATREFEEYRRRELSQYESDFDRAIKELQAQAEGDSGVQK